MEKQNNPYLPPAVAMFAVLAVVFAGLGGLVDAGPQRTLFAAGAGFWLLMLIVPWMFLSTKEWSRLVQSGICAAFGALCGVCFSLCFVPGEGFGVVLGNTALGALAGFLGYWLSLIRSGEIWHKD